jgi:hypothetical protein
VILQTLSLNSPEKINNMWLLICLSQKITVAVRSEAVFTRPNTRGYGLESHSRHACLRLFCVCVLLYR